MPEVKQGEQYRSRESREKGRIITVIGVFPNGDVLAYNTDHPRLTNIGRTTRMRTDTLMGRKWERVKK